MREYTLKNIKVILEPGTSFDISPKYIGCMGIDDIRISYGRCPGLSLVKFQEAGKVSIEILIDPTATCEMGQMFVGEEEMVPMDDMRTRLHGHHDIYRLEIQFEDEQGREITEEYSVSWDTETTNKEYDPTGMLCAPNIHEKTWVSENGNLYIVIHPELGIDDFFHKARCNDSGYTESLQQELED